METFIDDLDRTLHHFMHLQKKSKANMFILKSKCAIERDIKFSAYHFILQDIHSHRACPMSKGNSEKAKGV